MTFSEFKFYIKHALAETGRFQFWTIPMSHKTAGSAKLPVQGNVNISINKHGKKILNFEPNSFAGGSPNEAFFIIDKELAQAWATKIQMIRRNNMLQELKAFEKSTDVLNNYELYSEEYPEIFV